MGHLNSFSASGGGNLNKNFPKIPMPGGMFKLRFDWYITLIDLTKDVMDIVPGHCEIFQFIEYQLLFFFTWRVPMRQTDARGFFLPPAPTPVSRLQGLRELFCKIQGTWVACCKNLGSWKHYFFAAHKCESFAWVLIAIWKLMFTNFL